MGSTFGVGRQAPAFTLPATDGGTVSLSDYRGDWLPVLVFFTADDPRALARLAVFSAAAEALWGLRGQLVGIAVAEPEDLRRVELGDHEGRGQLGIAIHQDERGRQVARHAAQQRRLTGPRWPLEHDVGPTGQRRLDQFGLAGPGGAPGRPGVKPLGSGGTGTG